MDMERQAHVDSTALSNIGDSMPARSPEIMPFSVNTLFRMVKRSVPRQDLRPEFEPVLLF
ncbi:hypothetical protein WJ39_19275 [Burkholderia diffusa]|nr:hypothetical protein WJ39_19275 [Burkholderia diffusa]